MVLSKEGYKEVTLKAVVAIKEPTLTFRKLVTAKSNITSQDILSHIDNHTGYKVKGITLKDASFGSVTGTPPNLKITLTKYGNFTADLVLSKTGHLDATIKDAAFERTTNILPAPDDLTFSTLQKTYSSGGRFTANEILGQVNGTKDGYTLKAIQDLNPSGIARIAADKQSLEFIKVGNLTATLVLGHLTKADVEITGAKFEIVKGSYAGSLSFVKLKRDIAGGESATVTGVQLMSQIAGATSEGFTLKSIALDNASFGQVSGAKPNLQLTLKKRGNFTARIVLEHMNYLDVAIDAHFESILPNDQAEIISWKFGGEAATINGTNLVVELPYGTDVTSLKATVELSEGATISPNPAQSRNYTNPIDFTVTAQDGTTTKTYTVKVILRGMIQSWTGGWRNATAYSASIDDENGEVTLDVNSADFELEVTLVTGASIIPDPKTISNWKDNVTFTVKKGAESKKYNVKVTVGGKSIVYVTDADIKATMRAEAAKHGKNADYNYIDVSAVTDMKALFSHPHFNGDITKWDVSKVTSMKSMFDYAVEFNRDIGEWDVSKVTDMSFMFKGAFLFNQYIGHWDVSEVTNMDGMFFGYLNKMDFNQDIGNWNVSKVTSMRAMFYRSYSFNQDIGSWKVSKVTNMRDMFGEAKAFNQDIGNWNVSEVTNMQGMFDNATAFDQDIGNWNVSKVTNMQKMFSNATAFDQDIGSWTVSKVEDMSFNVQ